jgi:hypothetical protein
LSRMTQSVVRSGVFGAAMAASLLPTGNFGKSARKP